MTAVEFLVETIDKKYLNAFITRIVEQAKEMEKEQIMDAYYDGKGNGMDISHPLSRTKEISAEQYYNETFKSYDGTK